MALYQQSSLTYAQAKTDVARILSLEGDTDMLTHAGSAIKQAFQDWNNQRQWNFAKSNTVIVLVAPFSVASVTITNGSTTLTSSGGFGSVVVGDIVTGSGIQNETYITAVSATPFNTVTMSRAAVSPTSPGTVTFYRRDYALPTSAGTAVKYIYDVRLVSVGKILYPLTTRITDRINPDQTDIGEPSWYDDFPMGEAGKIRFLPTPSGAGTVIVKMYRRLTVPSSDSDVLDIPEDFEFGILSTAKGYFALDKTGGSPLSSSWFAIGREKQREAIAADSKRPDDDLAFLPPVFQAGSLDTTTLTYALAVAYDGEI